MADIHPVSGQIGRLQANGQALRSFAIATPSPMIIGPVAGNAILHGGANTSSIEARGYGNTIDADGASLLIDAGALGGAIVDTGTGNVRVNLSLYNNRVTGGSGNDIVSGGLGGCTVLLGDGRDEIHLDGSADLVMLGKGSDTVTGGMGSSRVILGSGNDTVLLTGFADTVTLGDGQDVISMGADRGQITAGNGNDRVSITHGAKTSIMLGQGNDNVYDTDGQDRVTLGSGRDTVVLGGYSNVVTLGNGQDFVSLAAGAATVAVGSGNDLIGLAGFDNTLSGGSGNDVVRGAQGDNIIKLGSGNDSVSLAASNNTVTLGDGRDTVALQGYDNQVTLGSGQDVIDGGIRSRITVTGSELSLNGGSEATVFLGAGFAKLDDRSSRLTIVDSRISGNAAIGDVAHDPGFVLDLAGGVGGFAGATAVVDALRSDGHGGTLLAFGIGSNARSIDFLGASEAMLTSAHFRIG